MKAAFLFLSLFLLASCKQAKDNASTTEDLLKRLELKYANGFSVDYYKDYKVLTISKPWPNAEVTYKYRISDKEANGDSREGITPLAKDIQRLVVTSTTHIPALELLGIESKLVGFPGTDYISSEKTRKRIDSGEIRELGRNESINTEVLIELNLDIVVGFGVEGVNKTFQTIEKAGIPVVYNGDWVENSPLAKAEWIKFFGVLFNKEQQADSVFNAIETDYLKAKQLAQKATNQPTVLSGAIHKDVWYLPNGNSPEAQLMKDANLNYLWSDTDGNGSLALSFEAVFSKAQNASLWLSPSYYSSMKSLEDANSLYKKFKAFKSKSIYSFSNTTGETGGVLYYELGTARPDLVLKDLIKIGHPNLLPDYTTHFFKPLP